LAGRVPVSLGSPAILTAPEYVYEPPAGSATTGSLYEFMYWDVDQALISTERARFVVPATLSVPRATAWYLPICLPGTSCGSGGPTAIATWAFSLTNYKVLSGTPISSVTPSSAWTSPSTSVSTASAVTINAASYFGTTTPPPPLTGGTVFSRWFVFPRTKSITVSGLALSAPAGASSYAIAFYYYYPPHTKPPCIGYPYCI